MRNNKLKSLLLLLSVVAVLSAEATAQSHASADHQEMQQRFVGAWRLVLLEEPSANGEVHKAECEGMFVFTQDGKAAVQVMYRNARTGSTYAQGGYEASYGSYHVDDLSTFTFHIEGGLVRTLIGKDLKRAYALSGNRLTITSADPKEHWRVVWERY